MQNRKTAIGNLREDFGIKGEMLMYIGNLELYQGIDLLLGSFWVIHGQKPEVHLVVVGGATPDIDRYRNMAERLGVADRVHFVGPCPGGARSAHSCRRRIFSCRHACSGPTRL